MQATYSPPDANTPEPPLLANIPDPPPLAEMIPEGNSGVLATDSSTVKALSVRIVSCHVIERLPPDRPEPTHSMLGGRTSVILKSSDLF